MFGTGALVLIIGVGWWLIAAFWDYVATEPGDDRWSRGFDAATRWMRRLGRIGVLTGVALIALAGAVSVAARLV